jgi:predicted nucleic acid-binding protein
MIEVDTSVWIDHFNGSKTSHMGLLRSLIGQHPVLVGDLILCEVLQGARSEHDARKLEAGMRRFEIARMLDPLIAVDAARNYRHLRSLGFTVRKTIDVIIGTFCVARDYTLLHDDRDFEPMECYLGLRVR